MNDEDPNIKVSLTNLNDPYCVQVDFGNIVVHLHTRSAIDLQRKLGNIVCDWIAATTINLLQRKDR